MRKTSKPLAIIASIFSLLLFIFIILMIIELLSTQKFDSLGPMKIIIMIITVLINAAGGIMGLIAARIVTQKHTTAGIMLIVCSVLCLINMLIAYTFLEVITLALFIIASVFALKREGKPAEAAPESQPSGPLRNIRKPGKVLGIVGGSFAFFISIVIFIYNTSYINANPQIFKNASMSEGLSIFLFMVPAIINFIVGILGLTAALIMKKRHTASGVMMIIGAVICIFGFFNVVSMVLLIIGSVFAIRPDRTAQAPPKPELPHVPLEQLQP